MLIINLFHILMLSLMFIAAIFLLKQTPSRIQNYLLVLVISVMLMILGYTLEINATTQSSALVGLKVGYLGKPFALFSSFLFITDRYGYAKKLGPRLRGVLLALSCMISALVFTCQSHTLFYSSIAYAETGGLFPHLELGHGPFYYVNMAMIFFYFISESIIVIWEMKKSDSNYERNQLLLVLGLVASGVVGFIVFLSGVTRGYDTTILGCFFGGAFLLLLFFKYRIFDALEVVKEYALNASDNGLIVFDPGNRAIYMNQMAMELFPTLEPGELSPVAQELLAQADVNQNFFWQDKVYLMQKSPVLSNHRNCGTSLEFSDITDSYLYSQRLENDVTERTRDILRIQRQITVGFANIVEARDGETGDHVKRTSRIVRLVADRLSENPAYKEVLTPAYITMLEQTAPLHDVGKISIPDSILLKPAALTAEETDMMRKHTLFGMALIEKTMRGVERDEYVMMAEDIAVYHHERWNGEGYPYGLSGEEIPLSARIMSIADVYDALRSKRHYKSIISREEAMDIILADSGKQFDPAVVQAFCRCIEEIESIYTAEAQAAM